MAGFAANQKFIDNVGAEAAEGILVVEAAPAPEWAAFQQFKQLMGKEDLFLYASQTWDQIALSGVRLAAPRLMVVGVLLVGFMMFRPEGLWREEPVKPGR